ncbi:hypothetical protein H5J22_05730 [Cetobacterium sp. 8H]|uniref:hypothetical protein n=1 Tax=Cetobacterium sp. 8H TaxID=2759681 RepID=UPI00163C2056|nr:hypothetical protein [Cetobacterium sp. 8H]MBC2850937.1 hypothetical protein [Cetobacterium sp. 8H]
MKKHTLLIFCDMVRGNLLHNINKNIKKSKFDLFLENLGGTLYTNAYTPAPDTGRAYSMLQTGLSCKKNGCDDVWKYPEFFLKEDIEILDEILLKEDIETTYIGTKRNDLSGVFSKKVKNKILIDFKIQTYEKSFLILNEKLKKFDKTFTWICLDDYHVAADDYGASMKSDDVGKEKLFNIFEKLFTVLDKNDFDEIIILSDHGNVHKYGFKDSRILNLLNDDRTKILLYRVTKKNQEFKLNNELRSILDVFPTIIESFELQNRKVCGVSLNQKVTDERIISMESYSEFLHLSPLNLWGCRSKDYFYLTNQNYKKMYQVRSPVDYKEINIDKEEEEKFIKVLKEETVNYEVKEKELKSIERYYEVLNYHYRYSDNSERNQFNKERLKSLKVKRVPYYISVLLSKLTKRGN